MAAEEELLRIFQRTETRGGPATEATLAELVRVLGGTVKKTNKTAEEIEEVGEASEQTGGSLGKLKRDTERYAREVRNLTRTSIRLVDDFATVGNSVSGAARTLDAIPLVGDIVADVLGALE